MAGPKKAGRSVRWFYAVVALGFGLIGMGAWQLRMRQVRKEVAAVFGERLRLSREIHDTLLQSLSICEETVEVHLKHIFTKLDVHDRTSAVYVALRRGIVHIG